jgi:hypothetical protein
MRVNALNRGIPRNCVDNSTQDFNHGLGVNGDRADGVFDEQSYFDDQHAFVSWRLLQVGEMGIRRQPTDALGVEQAGLDLGEDLDRIAQHQEKTAR